MDHYKNPRNFGKPEWKGEYFWEEMNPSCGDKIGMGLKLAAGGKKISEVRFWGEGCVVSMASASMLTEKVKEMGDLEKVENLKSEDVLKMLGGKEAIPVARLRCALLGLTALKRALGKKEDENGVD